MNGRAREAAAAIRECRRELAARGSTPVREAMAGGAADAVPVPWQRYPEGEVYDPVSHAQYFYHSHAVAAPPQAAGFAGHPAGRAECGHFHLFLRADGMPRGVAPLLFPEHAVANASTPPQAAPSRRGGSDRVAHLVGIAVDAGGEPVRLFTTNRWVTGETWYPGADVARMLDRFAPGAAAPLPLLSRWLGAVVQLYRGDIERLLRRRDEAVAKWRWLWPRRGSALEDSRLEIVSHCEIDLDRRLAEIDGLGGTSRPAAAHHRSAVPNIAEGWGV